VEDHCKEDECEQEEPKFAEEQEEPSFPIQVFAEPVPSPLLELPEGGESMERGEDGDEREADEEETRFDGYSIEDSSSPEQHPLVVSQVEPFLGAVDEEKILKKDPKATVP
jgi:hypothetical protein